MISGAVSAILGFAMPISLLSISWVRLFQLRQKSGFWGAALALVVLSFSYAIYVGSLWRPEILGPAYSDRRFLTIGANIGVTALILIIAWRKRIPVWRWITVVALLFGPVWFLILLLSAAV